MTINDYEKSKLSEQVYFNPENNSPDAGYELPNGFEFLESSGLTDSKEGFFGVAFKKDNEVIISFRGTNDINDFKDDWTIVSGKVTSQYNEALGFAKQIQEKYGESNRIFDPTRINVDLFSWIASRARNDFFLSFY